MVRNRVPQQPAEIEKTLGIDEEVPTWNAFGWWH